MATQLNLQVPTDGFRPIVMSNEKAPEHTTGMRVTNQGFFHITNKTFGGIEARLDSGGNWSIASDLKLKSDVQNFSNCLGKLVCLNPVDFHYNSQDKEEMPHKTIGFIAQDVEAIFPQLVSGEDTKYVNYTGLVPIVIGAIKEMKQHYDETIANLEMQLGELKRSLKQT
jgi:Chaperone of endosialidase